MLPLIRLESIHYIAFLFIILRNWCTGYADSSFSWFSQFLQANTSVKARPLCSKIPSSSSIISHQSSYHSMLYGLDSGSEPLWDRGPVSSLVTWRGPGIRVFDARAAARRFRNPGLDTGSVVQQTRILKASLNDPQINIYALFMLMKKSRWKFNEKYLYFRPLSRSWMCEFMHHFLIHLQGFRA
jgi:hypothetical protein